MKRKHIFTGLFITLAVLTLCGCERDPAKKAHRKKNESETASVIKEEEIGATYLESSLRDVGKATVIKLREVSADGHEDTLDYRLSQGEIKEFKRAIREATLSKGISLSAEDSTYELALFDKDGSSIMRFSVVDGVCLYEDKKIQSEDIENLIDYIIERES